MMTKRMQHKAGTVLCLVFLLFFLAACSALPAQLTVTDVAMGSVVSVNMCGARESSLQSLQPVNEIRAVEHAVSMMISGSEIDQINTANGQPVQVSGKTYAYLRAVSEIYAHSGGKAAVVSGALTKLWGFDTDAFRLPSGSELREGIPKCGDDKLVLGSDNTVSVPTGCVLNLGSVGKGIACDAAVAYLKAQPEITSGGTVSVGGSVGVYGLPASGENWTVGIRNPFGDENEYFAVLSVGESFLSTSGNYEKFFTAEDGQTYHHILDLTTGYPVQNELASVTVIADSGLTSDALSTLCFILGKDASLKVLQAYNAQAVFVFQNKTVYATEGIRDSLQITNSGFIVL